MDAKSFVKKHYGIDALAVSKHPSKDVWLIKAENEIFVLKDNQRYDFLTIEEEANQVLERHHIVTRKIIKNNLGYLCTGSFALFTYVPGTYKDNFNMDEIDSSLTFLAEYNKALAKVSKHEIDKINEYDEVKEIDYIVNTLPLEIDSYQADLYQKAMLKEAVQVITDNKDLLESLPKQLIHADLGADNFLFYKNAIYSIVDFTPDYDAEEYALAEYVYWCIYHNETWDYEKINNIKNSYFKKSGLKDNNAFYPLLVKAALIRVALTYMSGNTPIEKRFNFLDFILNGKEKIA